MTPKKKTGNSTTLAMERKVIAQAAEKTKKTSLHVAGGEHSGIVINKEVEVGGEEIPAHLCLEFRVFLVNANSGKHAQEKRVLSYWFKQQFPAVQRPRYAQDFFKQLVSPTDFPRGIFLKILGGNENFLFRLCWVHQEDHEADAALLPHVQENRGGANSGEGD